MGNIWQKIYAENPWSRCECREIVHILHIVCTTYSRALFSSWQVRSITVTATYTRYAMVTYRNKWPIAPKSVWKWNQTKTAEQFCSGKKNLVYVVRLKYSLFYFLARCMCFFARFSSFNWEGNASMTMPSETKRFAFRCFRLNLTQIANMWHILLYMHTAVVRTKL